MQFSVDSVDFKCLCNICIQYARVTIEKLKIPHSKYADMHQTVQYTKQKNYF